MHLTADVSHHQRARPLGVVVFIHALFFAALFTPAYADYLGRDAIMWFARFIIIPAGFISFVICGACALFRQDWLMRGIYAFVTCLGLLLVIKSGDFIVNLLIQQLGG